LEPWGYKLNGTVNFVVINSYNDEGEINISNKRVEVIKWKTMVIDKEADQRI